MTTAAQNSKQILAQKGTAATPSVSFLGGNASGMYLAGTNQLGFSTAGVNAVTIDSSGNVGIGTSSPGYVLDVNKNSATNSIRIGSYQDTSKQWLLDNANGGFTINGSGALSSTFMVNVSGSERMRIDSSGNVGIGTSSPAAKLDIGSGNLNFSGTAQRITGDFSNATLANRVAFQSSTVNGNTGIFIIPNGTATNANFQISNASNPINSSVGIFGVSGSTDVRIQSAIQGTGTYLPMTFYAGGSEAMRIDSSGNVGVGTSSPGALLTVAGTASFTGNTTVAAYSETVVAIGTVTTTNTLSIAAGTVQTATLTASTACTFTMPTATAGKSFILLLKQAATTGNGTATFTSVKWNSAGAPTITATAGKMDILTFVADGTNWYGSYSQGYTP